MSTFNRLLTKSLEENNLQYLLRFPRALLSKQEEKWIVWCGHYLTRYSSIPTPDRVKREFEFFIPISSADPLIDLYDQTLVTKKKEYTIRFLTEHESDLRDGADPTNLISELHGNLVSASVEVDYYSSFDRSAFFENQISMPFFIKELDEITGGIGFDDLVYLSGRPGSSKTTYLKWIAFNWIIRNKRILFISNENSSSTIIGGIDAMVGGWNPIKLRHGGWTDTEKKKVNVGSYLASIGGGEIIVPKGGRNNIESVLALADEYQPNVVLIDGVYLMHGQNRYAKGWEKEMEVSQGLKAFCLNKRCPVIGTIQQGRTTEGKRATREGTAGTDSYLKDADLFLATSVLSGTRTLEILKNRWGGEGTMLGIDIDFTRMSVTVSRAIFEEEEEDE